MQAKGEMAFIYAVKVLGIIFVPIVFVVSLNRKAVKKMPCDVLRCVNNADGYCMCSSYVEIDETGCCREINIKGGEENAAD